MSQGDHIYVNCGVYDHHGIDCGDGTVIHYTGEKLKGTIDCTPIAEFITGKTVFVREYGKCDPPDIVIQRAKSKLKEEKYDLFDNNCEHFATWCKTGKKESEQVHRAKAAAGGAAGSTGTATIISPFAHLDDPVAK
ncbi:MULTISPECIES: lecithin retinol acyltransferase family protein [Cyanophyceae]|uniref:lecithin retinol acyltransferase family protein n=1 Tax=Cyanophyceae TaxID=3028117 RepID=UPI0016836369|nr:lecithin retinol acyltransferase family protein [Trichocoleus sp. FACHB-69]MBD1935352.1 lecithin retinol acyltransferase family protein [Trichocoleus sp. FACHB-69]